MRIDVCRPTESDRQGSVLPGTRSRDSGRRCRHRRVMRRRRRWQQCCRGRRGERPTDRASHWPKTTLFLGDGSGGPGTPGDNRKRHCDRLPSIRPGCGWYGDAMGSPGVREPPGRSRAVHVPRKSGHRCSRTSPRKFTGMGPQVPPAAGQSMCCHANQQVIALWTFSALSTGRRGGVVVPTPTDYCRGKFARCST